jgi:hypothetical protein
MCDNLPNILIVDCPCCGNEVVAERPDPECALVPCPECDCVVDVVNLYLNQNPDQSDEYDN